jgi:glycosyltransferase involved in cell wall biosynthesis
VPREALRIHQFVAMLEPGAVGSHTLVARDVLRAAGHTSEVYTDLVHDACTNEGARPLAEYRGDADIIVYQLAIGSPAADVVLARAEPLVLNYHTFTPPELLEPWDHDAANGAAWGLAQLAQLAPRAALGVAVSEHNRAELDASGCARTTVVPILLPDQSRATVHEPASETTWLFVGRLAPNKAQRDLIKALSVYRRLFDPRAQLVLVGGGIESAYGQALIRFAEAIDVADAVTFTGPVDASQLSRFYDAASVFVVASDHEGFCVPLVEAMRAQVPIVAFGAAAIPETLGDAGLVLDSKDPFTFATAVRRVVGDRAVRAQLARAGARRAQTFDLAHVGPRFVAAVTSAA